MIAPLIALTGLCLMLAGAWLHARQRHQQAQQRWLESFDSAWYWFDQYHALREEIHALALWRDPPDTTNA
jgi:hypothetical protein